MQAIFGMNIREIIPGSGGSLLQYLRIAVPLTAITVWMMVAFQSKHFLGYKKLTILQQILWPVVFVKRLFHMKAVILKLMWLVRRICGRNTMTVDDEEQGLDHNGYQMTALPVRRG